MDRAIRLLVVAKRPQTSHDYILQIGLARIDYVIHPFASAESRPALWLWLGGRNVHFVIAVVLPRPVIKILPQQPEFPKLIRNVLADISDGPIRTDNHLAVFGIFIGLLLERARGHHPAAFVLTLGLEINGLALLEMLESLLPKFEIQYLALTRKHVIVDV